MIDPSLGSVVTASCKLKGSNLILQIKCVACVLLSITIFQYTVSVSMRFATKRKNMKEHICFTEQ